VEGPVIGVKWSLQAEDVEQIICTWGSDLVRRALGAEVAAGSRQKRQLVIPKRAFVFLSQFSKRALESAFTDQAVGWVTLRAGVDLHKRLVTSYIV
jgi:hypothetical protein